MADSDYEVTSGIKEFILGGDAQFTILQEATRNSSAVQMKYRVKQPKRSYTTPVWYVSTELSGVIGGVEYDGRNLTYQGYITFDVNGDYCFRIGNKGVQDYNKYAVNGLLWVLTHGDKLPSVVHVYHHGRCSVCGRKLTDAESLRCGIGPTCRKRM